MLNHKKLMSESELAQSLPEPEPQDRHPAQAKTSINFSSDNFEVI